MSLQEYIERLDVIIGRCQHEDWIWTGTDEEYEQSFDTDLARTLLVELIRDVHLETNQSGGDYVHDKRPLDESRILD